MWPTEIQLKMYALAYQSNYWRFLHHLIPQSAQEGLS